MHEGEEHPSPDLNSTPFSFQKKIHFFSRSPVLFSPNNNEIWFAYLSGQKFLFVIYWVVIFSPWFPYFFLWLPRRYFYGHPTNIGITRSTPTATPLVVISDESDEGKKIGLL